MLIPEVYLYFVVGIKKSSVGVQGPGITPFQENGEKGEFRDEIENQC